MTVFLRSFAAFSLVLQLSVSCLALAMEEKKWVGSDEKGEGKGVVRVAPRTVPSSFEVRQLLDGAAMTCITLQNIQYALVNFRFDLDIIRTALGPRPKSFFERRENTFYRGNKEDDGAYAQYLSERIAGCEKDERNYQKYYADAMEKLYPHETALIASRMNKTTPTVFRFLDGPPAITVKQNTAQVYGDYLEKRISMGDTAALLLKLEGLENETLGFEKDQAAADALRRDLIARGLLKEEKKEEKKEVKKVESQKASSPVLRSSKKRSSAITKHLSEVDVLSAVHHTLFDIKNLIEKMGGCVAVTTRKKKKILKIDVTIHGQSQTFYQQGDKRMRKKQLQDFLQAVQ